MRLDALEETVNDLSDRDLNWWPFLWLRPEKEVPLSLARVTSVSVLYGTPFGVLMGFALSWLRGALSAAELAATVGAFPLAMLFVGTLIVAPMWNRRAERLRVRYSLSRTMPTE